VYTFLPISQLDASQYANPPENADLAARAAIFTIIARAIGITKGVENLIDVAIDKYFWDDAGQQSRWLGPVRNHATLGTLTEIDADAPIEVANVLGVMDGQQLALLRGNYEDDGGNKVRHWMLGTLYTRDDTATPNALIAHDPWTGQQVTIDLLTKKVIVPGDFPLNKFKVNAYQPVTLN
jgi:hypothetical protein